MNVLALNDGCAHSACGEVASRLTGAKSLIASYGGLEYTSALMVCGASASSRV